MIGSHAWVICWCPSGEEVGRIFGTFGFYMGERALLGGKFSKYREGNWMGSKRKNAHYSAFGHHPSVEASRDVAA